MLLALDIGNTNITAGVFDGARLCAQWRLSTHRDRTADELAAFLKIALDARDIHFGDITGVAVSSVVPSLTPQTVYLAREYFKLDAVVVGPDTNTGLVNDYDSPRDVGADRLVNGLAAWKKFGTAVLIVDFGTATTVDAVSHHGHYLGGAIAPGLQISTNALFQAAARLPRVDLAAPPHALGTNTVHSTQSGIVFGYAGMVKELVTRCLPEVQEKSDGNAVTVAATGGLAELIAPHVPQIAHIEPHLTLEGLRLIWEANHA
ncbi:MAG TPA: type III pantothenate kinase [Abditibacteriaceae bacterium]|jgi:type III pantothenate kinase